MNGQDPIEVSRSQLLDSLGVLGADLGISRVVAQIYGLLYLSDGPLSLDEIADHLNVSKATVSVNARALERWGAVRKTWMEGSRRDYYLAERDTLRIAWSVLQEGFLRRLDRFRGPFDQMYQETEARRREARSREEMEQLDRTLARMREMRRMEERIRRLLSAPEWLRRILGGKA